MLLQSPLAPSPPFVSSSSIKSRDLCLYPLRPHHSISIAKREVLTIVGASRSQLHSDGTVDFEESHLHWSSLFRQVLYAEKGRKTASRVLEMWDPLEKRLTKWELCRVTKELRKYRRFKLALEVHGWMMAQGDRFPIGSGDMAVQLDLIGKVQGPVIAEQNFFSLPYSFKDKCTYCSLLNTYVQYRLKEKAEATFGLMRENGYLTGSLSYNVMMTLYLNIGENDIVVKLVREMKERNIKLDICSYNIWISNAAAMQDLYEMERLLEIMQSDNVNVHWTACTTLASTFMKFNLLDKAGVCLREGERRIEGRDHNTFQIFIALYGSIGKREDVYRIWNWYKSSFDSPINTGYKTMLETLLKLGDVAAAELVYKEWTRDVVGLDPRVCQILMGWYCRNGLCDRARETLDQLVQHGGKPNQAAWETLVEGCVKEKKLSEAVSCLEKAVSCAIAGSGKNKWRPKPRLIKDLLEICKQREQSESLDQVVAILRRGGLDHIEPYQGFIRNFSLVASD